jgi:hypothetical protein
MRQKVRQKINFGTVYLVLEDLTNNFLKAFSRWLDMELDLQSLYGLHVYTAGLIGWDPATSPPHLGSYTSALLVSQDRRHLFVTPCS